MIMKRLYILLVLFLVFIQAFSQATTEPSPIVFIYDASGSMWGQIQGKTKMEIASKVLSKSINKLPADQRIGLIVYGHRRKGDCKDVEMLVDMENSDKTTITTAVNAVKPLGKTPLAHSASQVIAQLKQSKKKATIVLITDGIESCDGNLCKVVQEAKSEGIDFKLHIVGFGLKENETDNLKCAAKAGGGNYFDADNAIALDEAMEEATAQTVDMPKGNISVFATKNGEAIDAYVTAYLNGNKQAVAGRTYKDTAFIYLSPNTYELRIKPLGGSDVNAVSIPKVTSFENQITHKDVSFDAGKLKVYTSNNKEGWDATVKVLNLEGKQIASTRTYGRAKEIEVNPGTYKVAFQALRIKGLDTYYEEQSVPIKANSTIETSYDFKSGIVFIDAKVNGNSIDTIIKFLESTTGKNVDSGRTYDRGKEFLLNPGTYRVNIQPLGNYKDRAAQNLVIEVKEGGKISKEVNF